MVYGCFSCTLYKGKQSALTLQTAKLPVKGVGPLRIEPEIDGSLQTNISISYLETTVTFTNDDFGPVLLLKQANFSGLK